MPDVVLATLNAKWEHASFGLRCLHAALGPLADRCALHEATIHDRPSDVVEALLAHEPRLIGLGVYVWNAGLMLEVVRQLKALRPDVVVVLGGPEVSHEVDQQLLCALADVVVTGEGETAFAQLVAAFLADPTAPLPHVIKGGAPDLTALPSPYPRYTDDDLHKRIVYVEASRGCPFTCAFCLSALDEAVRMVPLAAFLAEMEALLARGLRRFKFIDRTFNLKIRDATQILQFFLDRLDPGLFLHFEMVPDRLPDALRAVLAQFPPGTVQLEVGIQTFNPAASATIARRQDVAKLEDNLRWLRANTGVHVHADLIVGLPGEDMVSFGQGFDRLYALAPQEIQVGVLKRLRGTPITRLDAAMVYSESPPYEVLRTDAMSFDDLQRMKRFARYFDLVHNSGRFPATGAMLFGDAPFDRFLAFADWLWADTHATAGIALPRLARLLGRHLTEARGFEPGDVDAALERDLGKANAPAGMKRQARHG